MPWVEVSENNPGRVDQAIRTAIHECWHALPPHRQNLEQVEQVFRRLVDRALDELREDAALFAAGGENGEETDEELP